jgi:hypothetical protein
MSESESKDNSSNGVIDTSKRYIDTSYKYLKLKIFHLLTTNVAMLSKMLLIGGLFTIGTIFLSISGALAIGEYLGNMSLGFLIISLVFLLIGLIMYLLRSTINKAIVRNMSDKFFETPKKVKSEESKRRESKQQVANNTKNDI